MAKRIKLLLLMLLLVCTLTFIGCTTTPGTQGGDNDINTDVLPVVNLETPKNVNVSLTDEKIKITFDEVLNASNYTVVISNYKEVVSTTKVDNNIYSFDISKLSNGAYFVKVRANGDGEKYYNSVYSEEVRFTVSNQSIDPTTKLSSPTSVTVTKHEQSVLVTFSKVSNANGYKIVLLDSNNVAVITKTIASNLNSATIDTSSVIDGTYNIGVIAVGDNINYSDSEYSQYIEVVVKDGSPNLDNNTNDDDPLQDLSAYYKACEGLTGTALKAKLRQIITDTHKKVTTYTQLKEYLQNADEDPNNSSNMLLFYTAESIKKTDNMNIWNREHVWAQSLTSNWFGTSGAGADMHHIRPCNPSVNSSRGNDKFGERSGYYLPLNVNGSNQDYRGDVARIILYMFTRYTQADSRKFTDIFDSLDTILKWNKLDPVSETEIIRNEYTYKIQGNKNPFIDYPEFADAIWG